MSRHTGGEQQVLKGFFLTKFIAINGEEPVRFLPTSSQQGRKRKRHHNADGDKDTYLTDDGDDVAFPVDTNTPLNFLGHDIVHVVGFSDGCLLTTLERDYPMTYMICNPVNKQHIVLPKPNLATRVLVHGFTCDATLTHYKVVRALVFKPMVYTTILTLEVFSSDLPQWRQLNGTSPFRFFLNMGLRFSAVINKGVTYFAGYFEKQTTNRPCICILVFDQSKEMLQVMETPPREDDFDSCQFFGMSDGLIVYGYYELHQLIIWLLNDKGDGKREWSLKHKVNLKSTVENYLECAKDARDGYIKLMAFHPANTEVFYLRCGAKTYQYHVKKPRFELVCDFEQQVWTAMIVGFAFHGYGGCALELFHEMQDTVMPNQVTFVAVLTACSHGGLVDQGLKVFNGMKMFGIEPGVEHYGCLVDLLARAGNVSEAKSVIQKMPMKPSGSIWGLC
ncbi:Pentatricopeptide repeat-containing protein [Thalictrum thalictroides]|uniref:Pentatricopeptide repeat-containing protein n=1 Tax=Thalictrum thalictroides TaxID=46969 RepID=A0A7J6XE91_THATH|nr:Pentatricopeptide repeat-containing protein [Thalictrum thalictroides]